ncbi:LGFP repeat-containing protein, partial [Microbacterium sp. NPDC058021]|uniref:LGFP repeat-containing protein n=1 Tax=Microbacterium sp. NPDC058021 TaxID=3346306 RepID=UPI0036DEDE7C
MMRPPARQVSVRSKALTALLGVLLMFLGALVAVPAQAVPVAAEVGVVRAGPAVDGGIVRAADLSQFRPGNIVSDAVFYNAGTMSEAQIQAFLNSKVTACRAGYVCLKDKTDLTRAVGADAMCNAYAGGGVESAARIIFKVAQACGINPQALIVMLQKEQGLVTDTYPYDSQYRIAMGQGCPDTAACDSRYFGFFNQVHGAAWQLKRYANPPGTSNYFTWYAPGKTWNVRYHPNIDCGSSPVYIENKATAALYYYTPYQPNAAALRAGYGTGDGCSSYGNRNFYQYFNDWFGSTRRDHVAEIAAEHAAQGGDATLGAPVSAVLEITRNGGGFARAYANGSIYWTPSIGAKTVWAGALRDYYFARSGADGPLGWPTHNQSTLPGGVAQPFTGGSIYAGPAGAFAVSGVIRDGYFRENGAAGRLGWPTSEQSCAGAVCRQNFEGGAVVASPAGSFAVVQPVLGAFDAAGGAGGAWGAPVMTAAPIAANGGGFGQA